MCTSELELHVGTKKPKRPSIGFYASAASMLRNFRLTVAGSKESARRILTEECTPSFPDHRSALRWKSPKTAKVLCHKNIREGHCHQPWYLSEWSKLQWDGKQGLQSRDCLTRRKTHLTAKKGDPRVLCFGMRLLRGGREDSVMSSKSELPRVATILCEHE